MKKIVVCGAILSLVLWACDASVSNAALPSVGNGNSVPASFAAISSSSESSASENASSADADESELSSGETQKSSSSNPAAISSSSKNWWDYDTRGCCPDTLYIENGDSIFHFIPGASCPPPSVITVSCVPPAVVNKDSLTTKYTHLNLAYYEHAQIGNYQSACPIEEKQNIKLTVGLQRSNQDLVQYCITVPQVPK